jgi:predicted metalloprotease
MAAGCGSSETSSTPTPTADSDAEALERLPRVPQATESTRPPEGLEIVFDDVQAMWAREFEAADMEYRAATITIFRDAVDTACGAQPASAGPFYCPADRGVYLDTRFFDALSRRTGVRLGDLAQAYVVAHEVAHHVQALLGILGSVHAEDQRDPGGRNARSVRLELQADCLAGVWKHSSYQRGQVSQEDIADALRAAAGVGDDFTQLRATGTIVPEDRTHGSSAQRQQWLTTGFEQGRPGACDTFGA